MLKLLEMQRHAMLMYTSCGWFFNDVSGIETQQILRYAGRVLQLAKRCFGVDLEPEVLDRLGSAKSNLPESGSGRDIYERHVRPATVEFAGVPAHYAIASLFETFPARTHLNCYDIETEDLQIFEAGSAKVSAGRLRIHVAKAAQKYIQDLSTALNPQEKKQDPSGGDEMNWTKYLNK